MPVRRFLLIVMIAVVFAGACSGGEAADQSVPVPPSNAADVRFLQAVLVNDEAALRLAELTIKRGPGKEILGFAESLLSDRRVEVPYVQNLLRFIGASRDSGAAADPAITPAELDRMEGAAGREAERMFLELLVRLNNATLGFAKAEMSEGFFVDAKTHAETLITEREAELTTAQRLLTESGASSS